MQCEIRSWRSLWPLMTHCPVPCMAIATPVRWVLHASASSRSALHLLCTGAKCWVVESQAQKEVSVTLDSIHFPSLQLSQRYFRLAKSGSTEERWCHQQKVTRTVLSNQLWSSRVKFGAFSVNKSKDMALQAVLDSINTCSLKGLWYHSHTGF